ncbi:MAG: glutathione S-transferase [Deltaproteobacteria bacterium]|nr:glutathione S-transferase [Deltaproteobacteria bacterium]
MGKPTIYGVATSRALRSIWAIEEVGIDHEHVPTHFGKESKTPEYLAINPNGRVPALKDGELTLFESMAINLYLAKTHGGALYPADPADEARTWQWSVWPISELEPHLMQMVIHGVMLPEEKRRPGAVSEAEAALARPLRVLDAHLADRAYLLGDDFTIADLNVAGVLSLAHFAGYDYSGYPHVSEWADRCYDRPSFGRAQASGR